MTNIYRLPPIDPQKGEWDEATISRRQFLTLGFWLTAGAAGAVVGGTAITYLVGNSGAATPGHWVEVGKLEELQPGAVHQANYSFRTKDAWREMEKSGTVYAFTDDGTQYTVLSATCTHLGCNVYWKDDTGQFACPCHQALFSRAGDVISGPPPRPLLHLQTKVEDGVLMALI